MRLDVELLRAVTPETLRLWLVTYGFKPSRWPGRSTDTERCAKTSNVVDGEVEWWEHYSDVRRGYLGIGDPTSQGYATQVAEIIDAILVEGVLRRRATQAILDSLTMSVEIAVCMGKSHG